MRSRTIGDSRKCELAPIFFPSNKRVYVHYSLLTFECRNLSNNKIQVLPWKLFDGLVILELYDLKVHLRMHDM